MDDPESAQAPLSNGELARIFHEIGDMLEVKGELVFKTVAYHRAADAIAHSPVEVARAYREGNPPRIAGVGEAIARKIEELARTGHLAFYERLREEVPPSLVALLGIPGVGPRTVKQLHEELGVETLDDLRRAAEAGTLRGLRGMSEKTEEQVLAGIATLENRKDRMRLGQAEAIVETLLAELADTPGLRSIQPAGSFRRRRETVGDLDLLAETDQPLELVDRFVGLPSVESVIAKGPHKAAVRLLRGPQVDLMVMPPGEAGTYLIHFTGSKEHNVRLRGMARDRGWSLSEKGYLRLGDDGEPATGDAADLRIFPNEAEAYGFLGLPFIEPELREDRGEIEAALAGELPRLVARTDLRGDCHSHSDWSDGVHAIEQMAESARRRGYAYLVLTDHTVSLAIARGLDLERVERQRRIVAALNERFAREEEAGAAPPETAPEGFRLLHGCELEVRADATLDYPDELLATYDLVVGSVHVARRQNREQLTARTLAAIRSPHVDVIAHPAGRYIGSREDLDLDWDTIYEEAARTGTALELNGSDERLDLSDVRARRAAEIGCVFAIDSDAHRTEELDNLRWGTAMARRAWLGPDRVVNTRSRAELIEWAAGKPGRV
ncbi:MAG TPA: DNA polymerase/3'-5' exonuclease PolX [Candidatus Limnocylindrales bacterium]|jgi:DNA polymerase IV (family X)|nr:DNA polymerase/3'-5' exonuclease PolX [Candidatus Limnocylindrales bacterium]